MTGLRIDPTDDRAAEPRREASRRVGTLSWRLASRSVAGWLACAGAVVVLGAVGCGIGLSGTSESAGGTTEEADAGYPVTRDAGAANDAPKSSLTPVGEDAGTVVDSVARTQGSPLCGIPSSAEAGAVCNPDLGSCTSSVGSGGSALDAGVTVPDASVAIGLDGSISLGLDAAVATAPGYACRVSEVRSEAGTLTAAPTCSVAGLGKVESPCVGSSDCAAGFECVINSQTATGDDASGYNALAGVCRHYCCDNTCPSEHAFCDIEPTVGGSANVPVCAPSPKGDAGAACELLDDATCGGSGLVCQVVNAATGDVACVTPGTATVGQSCETTKCTKGLSCIAGAFPNRTCAQLCNRENSDCPVGETCMLNAAFTSANAQIGVCTQ